MVVELKPHQSRALKDLSPGKILRGDVGSGKSHTALMFWYNKICGGIPPMKNVAFRPMTDPVDLYVITTVKNRDTLEWEDKAAEFGVGRSPNQDGVKMHVDSWNNITDYEHVTDSFFIFDEQRLVGSGAWVKAFLKIAKNNRWILLSGTPGDTWADYAAVFIANGYFKNRTEYLREHAVYSRFTQFPKIEKWIHTRTLEKYRDAILVEMEFERHTIRHVELTLVEHNEELFERATKQRWHVFEERPLRDAGELQTVMRKIVNSDPSRLGELQRKLEKHPKLIVFYNFNYELDMLRIFADNMNYPVGEWNGHKHESIPKTDKWLYLVQYTAGAEGWNCIETNAMVFWSLNYSWKINEQSKGRIDRMNTPFTDLYYYLFRSSSAVDMSIWRAIMTKQDFNMSRYAKKLWDAYVPF